MKYLGRLLIYLSIFFAVSSVGCVLIFRFLPVTVSPYKAVRSWEAGRTFRGPRSPWVPLDKISENMVRAVVATEDNNFMTHRGFDLDAIKLAFEERRERGRVRGASTISQQTAKNTFCTPSGTWLRKGVESYFTVLIETLWGKKRIMEVYLNAMEVGPGVYGAQAAAVDYFATSAGDLSPAQAAMIATVLPNPGRMRLENPSAYMQRRSKQVVSLMNKLPAPEF
ncbi:MAG: monofunctional biosynthetic peptidoglycan transglycosylase [Rikenellaceae bacterium]|nr:monofunctional biosynthetic peptidoglycan transglycosylase [Rikenellaceae bacterium]